MTGKVYVTLPGAKEPALLKASSTIPDGTDIDASAGAVTLTVAVGNGETKTAEARGGTFAIRLGAITVLALSEPLACAKRASASTGKKKKKKKRSLWVHDTGGDWRTEGRYASGTVEGTTWTTTDTCDATTIRVSEGTVRVKPKKGGKAVRVTAPHSRTVRAPRKG